MPTPKQGTLQHPDLEILRLPRKKKWFSGDVEFVFWLTFIMAIFCGFNISACALGRFFLDHFRLWDWAIPSDIPNLDKHAELIAALAASCVATPATIGLLLILVYVDDELEKRRFTFQFQDHDYAILWVYIFVTWALVVLLGAMLRPRFHHISALSMLGVYGFGNMLLLPTLGLLGGISLGSWHLWYKWSRR